MIHFSVLYIYLLCFSVMIYVLHNKSSGTCLFPMILQNPADSVRRWRRIDRRQSIDIILNYEMIYDVKFINIFIVCFQWFCRIKLIVVEEDRQEAVHWKATINHQQHYPGVAGRIILHTVNKYILCASEYLNFGHFRPANHLFSESISSCLTAINHQYHYQLSIQDGELLN